VSKPRGSATSAGRSDERGSARFGYPAGAKWRGWGSATSAWRTALVLTRPFGLRGARSASSTFASWS